MEKRYSPKDQWIAINHLARNFKLFSASLIVLNLISWFFTFEFYRKKPIVINSEGSKTFVYEGSEQSQNVTDKEIKRFVNKYIKLRYEWDEFSPKKITKQVSPITTLGFSKKVRKRLNGNQFKGMNRAKISQRIINLEVDITKERILASFDRIIKIEGVPLVNPTKVSLNIIQAKQNYWSPFGLYVNGVIEYSEK